MRRLVLTLWLCLIALPALATVGLLSLGYTTPVFTPQWSDLRLGAGGQVTSVEVKSDGTTTIRTDTYGAYFLKSSGSCTMGASTFASPCWQQLVTSNSLPSSLVNLTVGGSGNIGVVEIVACQSNTDVLYMIFANTLLVSTNKGAAWIATPQTVTQNANSGPKEEGPFLYCDPSNPDIIYTSTPSGGVFKSVNGRSGGSATFSAVAAVGTGGSSRGHIFAVDPNSSVVGGVTQHFMICTYGTGCYETTNGGTSYALTTSTPTTFSRIICDKFSQFWLVNTTTTLYKYVSSSWSTSTPGGSPASIASDPNSASSGANKIALAQFSGDLIITSNNGSTWSGPFFNAPVPTASGNEPGWLGVANQQSGGSLFLNTLAIAFDSSSNLLNAAGLGVWKTAAPITATGTIWTSISLGIEQLVTISVIVPPGNSPITGVWDKGFFLNKNPDVFPSIYWTNATSNAYGSLHPIEGGWALDYASGNPFCLTGWENSNAGTGTAPATSADGGNTWTLWPALPASTQVSGNIATSSCSKWIVVPGFGKQIYWTANTAATFTAATITGSPTDWVGQIGVGISLASDRVGVDTYCAFRSLGAGNVGFYSSTNGGQNLAQVNSGTVDGNINQSYILGVPGKSGHFFWTAGGQGGGLTTHLWKTTDTCATWNAVGGSTLREVLAIGFGATKTGASYPTIYVYGYLSGVLGFYQSTDGATTWTPISVPASETPWPLYSIDLVSWVTGDPNVYGRIYVGFRGSGGAFIDTADACPWVNFSNTNPNAALTGTVTLTSQHSGLVPVTSVQYNVDGVDIGAAQTGAGPYSISWNASGVTPGAHTLKVTATGASCNGSFSIPITTSSLEPANDNSPIWLNQVA